MGSPPPMREIRRKSNQTMMMIGITPAYAGNTLLRDYSEDAKEDHPRLCGKYRFLLCRVTIGLGSPPPMREILIGCGVFSVVSRITPADAGNTLKNPNKIAIFPRLNSKNYLLFKINPLLHTILQNYNLMKETLTILSN